MNERRTAGELPASRPSEWIIGPIPPIAHPYHRTVPVVVILLVVVALGGGAAIGYLVAARRRKPLAVPPERSTSPATALSATVIDALGTGVVVLDRDERVRLVNPAARGMGILTGDRLEIADLVELTRTVIREARSAHAEIRLPAGRLGREPIAVAASAVPLGDPAQPDRVGSVALLLDDVTEAHRLEAVRRDFVANVSHELKTPVGALTLLAEAVQDAADDPAAVARFAKSMQREGTRLGQLVGELIDLSRLQGADPLPGANLVEVAAVIADACDRIRLVAEQGDITLVRRAPADLWVRGNENQLVTAVRNLLDNAVAYSPPGTRVAVHARVADGDDDPIVEVSVSDQGIGIAEADQARVFERFYRVDPARSRATGGTGLGLAIVKHVATNHGGDVSVWSAEGEGSTFTIRLPLVHVGPASSALPPLVPAMAAAPVLRGIVSR
jgi:two-component system, OmpR family, sensor histidine kinase SenX3